MTELTAQQRAEKKRAEKRKGAAVFAPVRFSESVEKTSEQKKAWIESVISRHGGTREAALLAAFEALENNLN